MVELDIDLFADDLPEWSLNAEVLPEAASPNTAGCFGSVACFGGSASTVGCLACAGG